MVAGHSFGILLVVIVGDDAAAEHGADHRYDGPGVAGVKKYMRGEAGFLENGIDQRADRGFLVHQDKGFVFKM